MKRLLGTTILISTVLLGTSCSKEEPMVNDTKQNSAQSLNEIQSFNSLELYRGAFRKVNPNFDGCNSEIENCHPQDIIITGAQQTTLDLAILNQSVSSLFSNDVIATQYIPEWNSTWFADIRVAILSGNYTFLKAGSSLYLLGVQGTLNKTSFEYAIPYQVL